MSSRVVSFRSRPCHGTPFPWTIITLGCTALFQCGTNTLLQTSTNQKYTYIYHHSRHSNGTGAPLTEIFTVERLPCPSHTRVVPCEHNSATKDHIRENFLYKISTVDVCCRKNASNSRSLSNGIEPPAWGAFSCFCTRQWYIVDISASSVTKSQNCVSYEVYGNVWSG